MATFQVWYSTGEYGKAWFEADSLAEAEALLQQVREGKLEFYELPEFQNKVKGYELEFSHTEELND